MLNYVVLVGRLTKLSKIKNLENGIQTNKIIIATPRSYKNENGEYDTDFIKIVLYSKLAENTINYCNIGDLIGIKGHIQQDKNKTLKIIADKVTFLAQKGKE